MVTERPASRGPGGEPGPTLQSIALYKHGVGAFQWSATAGADGTLIIPIPAQQIDDVLKSLLVLAADGSGVSSISYAADEPVQRQLRNFGVNLQDVQGMADLLARMVGATVRLRLGSDQLQGQILATEQFERQVDDRTVREEWLLLLTEAGAIERIDLAAVRGLEVIKGETAERLKAQLDLLLLARQLDVTHLMLRAQPGQKLSLSYVAEAPVWKMTYRLVVSDAGEPFLQGWAIAENTSATDWNEVSLALISGMPLSFTLDLRHPRFRTRPAAAIPEIEAIAPPVAEGAIASAPVAPAAEAFALSMADAGDIAPRGAAARMQKLRGARAFSGEALAAAPPPPTTARAIGDLFEYHLDQPITIPAQQAALLPVLAASIGGKTVSVYNAGVHPVHPLNAVRLVNTTALTLDAGPITVLRDDTYAGEALIDVIKPGDERLISYAVDLGCRVESQQHTGERRVIRVRIRRGVLHYDLRETATTTYQITSVTADSRTVVIEHPVRAGWDRPDPAPTETTASYHRYEVDVPPRQAIRWVVEDSHTVEEQTTLVSSSRDLIVWVIAQTGSDPRLRPVLEELASHFRLVSERMSIVQRIQAEIQTVTADQGRLSNNLQALGQGREERDLARRYVDELGRSEDRMNELRESHTRAQQELDQATATLHTFIDGLELDRPVGEAA